MPLHTVPSDRYTIFAIRLSRARPGLHSFITTLAPDWAAVDRILRRVCLRLWEEYETYEPGTNFLNWAIAIASRQMLHDHQTEPVVFSAALAQRLAEDALAAGELERLAAERRAIGRCLAKLPPGDRNLIRELYSARQTDRAIAAQMNRPVEHIHHRLSHLRRALKRCSEHSHNPPAPEAGA